MSLLRLVKKVASDENSDKHSLFASTMCGRFALHRRRQDIVHMVDYDNLEPEEWENEDEFRDDFFNVPPNANSVVLRRNPANGNRLVLTTMRWGVVPSWAKHDEMKNLNTINARGEALTESNSGIWNSIKGKRRCIVPCDGYYEWMKKGKERVPYFIKHKPRGDGAVGSQGPLMLLAGLWDSVVLEGSTTPLQTFAIVTTESNKQLTPLHDRMPVILYDQKDIDTWLNVEGWTKAVADLVRPFSAAQLEWYQVPKEVGKVGNQSPSFVLPVAQRKDGIQAMFAKQVARTTSIVGSSQSTLDVEATQQEGDHDDASTSTPLSPVTLGKRGLEEDSSITDTPLKKKSKVDATGRSPTKKAATKGKKAVELKPGQKQITGFFAKPAA